MATNQYSSYSAFRCFWSREKEEKTTDGRSKSRAHKHTTRSGHGGVQQGKQIWPVCCLVTVQRKQLICHFCFTAPCPGLLSSYHLTVPQKPFSSHLDEGNGNRQLDTTTVCIVFPWHFSTVVPYRSTSSFTETQVGFLLCVCVVEN